jgi:hypothetical protein
VTSRHCPCDRYSNYLSRPHILILPILIIILMLEHHCPTHSCDPTVLCGVGAGIQDFLHSDSFVLWRSCHSCNFIRSCFVGWSSLNSIVRHHSNSIGSRVTSPCRCQVQSIFRVNAISSRGIQLVLFAPLRTSSRCTKPWYLPVASQLQCIELSTSQVNLFAIYTTLFITFRSSYIVLCYHTMLAGALWGIKCDKQALPLRPVF